ncbi:hypothetical protein MRX96_012504 [Rhipicephalus microplus]
MVAKKPSRIQGLTSNVSARTNILQARKFYKSSVTDRACALTPGKKLRGRARRVVFHTARRKRRDWQPERPLKEFLPFGCARVLIGSGRIASTFCDDAQSPRCWVRSLRCRSAGDARGDAAVMGVAEQRRATWRRSKMTHPEVRERAVGARRSGTDSLLRQYCIALHVLPRRRDNDA